MLARSYDAAGRLATVTNERGKVRAYGYDELGNKTGAVQAT